MKVLLINGSPHIDGCTNAALSEIASTLQKDDKQIKILKDKQIEIENFNWSDSHTKEELEETFKVFDVN